MSIVALTSVVAAVNTIGGPLPGLLPLFPSDNWWNLDISAAPVDSASASFISFIGSNRALHPDFGGDVSTGSAEVYGFPYAAVDGTVTPRAVQFQYGAESDGVNHTTNQSFPFYQIPDEAMTQPHWMRAANDRRQGDRIHDGLAVFSTAANDLKRHRAPRRWYNPRRLPMASRRASR